MYRQSTIDLYRTRFGLNFSDRGLFSRWHLYRSADKSLARPGTKKATATEDFNVHISYL